MFAECAKNQRPSTERITFSLMSWWSRSCQES